MLTRSILAGAIAAVAIITTGCGSSKPAAPRTSTATAVSSGPSTVVTPPDSPAGAQARWLLIASAHLPIPDAELRAHFDSAFLTQVNPAALNTALEEVGATLRGSGAVGLASIEVDQPLQLVATLSRAGNPPQFTVSLAVDSRGLISGLLFKPLTPAAPTRWRAIDAAVRSVAPEVRILVADTTGGSCRPVHAIDPAAAAPLGSTFKLYVLDALGNAVASGKISWNQPLTITTKLKSLPSGELQTMPDGTRVSVRDVAAKLISISDNTAADMLIDLLGRPAIETALARTGISDPARDRPFLTPRELFILKLDRWPALAQPYAAAAEAGRRALLAGTVDKMRLPALGAATAWTSPRDIDTIEWFASADDLCRVYTSLIALARRPGLAPIADALQINDGGLGLDRSRWKSTWFKGGSEPGVLTLTYLATTRTGHSYFVAVLAENPSAPIDQAPASLTLLSAIKAAFTLAAAGR